MELQRQRQGGGMQQAPPRMRPFAQPVRGGQMQRRRQEHVGRFPDEAGVVEAPGGQPVHGEIGGEEPRPQRPPDADRQERDGGEVGQADEQSRGPVVGPYLKRRGDEERQQGAGDASAAAHGLREWRQVAGLEDPDPGQQQGVLVAVDPLARPEQRLQRCTGEQNRSDEGKGSSHPGGAGARLGDARRCRTLRGRRGRRGIPAEFVAESIMPVAGVKIRADRRVCTATASCV